jgi:hypothetical protein
MMKVFCELPSQLLAPVVGQVVLSPKGSRLRPMILHVKKLNNDRTEIWLYDQPRHTVATDAIRNGFLAVADAEEARTFAAISANRRVSVLRRPQYRRDRYQAGADRCGTLTMTVSKALYSCNDATWSAAKCCPVWSADDLTTS